MKLPKCPWVKWPAMTGFGGTLTSRARSATPVPPQTLALLALNTSALAPSGDRGNLTSVVACCCGGRWRPCFKGPHPCEQARGTDQKHGPTGLSLILCPVCEEDQVIEHVSNTKANPHKRFLKCLRNEPNVSKFRLHIVDWDPLLIRF